MRKLALLLIFLMIFTLPAFCQTSVALMPIPRIQWFLPNGTPNAGGCLFFTQSGTSTPAPTFVDVNGVIMNSNPVILDSSGYATVYLEDIEYGVAEWSAGGSNCASGSQIWSQQGVSAFQILGTTPGIIFTSVASSPAGAAGQLGPYNSFLGCLLLYDPSADCLLTQTNTLAVTNKTFNVSLNNFQCPTNTAGLYLRDNGTQLVCAPLNLSDETTVFTLSSTTPALANGIAKLSGGTVTAALVTDTGGFAGICISGCTTLGGNALIQSQGIGSCVFDGATTAGDYVINSTMIAGNCHDSGTAPPGSPASGQVIGRVLSTNAGAGTYTLELFGPETVLANKQGASPGCTNFTPVTIANNNSAQNLMSCTLAANALIQGSMIEINLTGIESTALGATDFILISASVGGATPCVTEASAGVANNQPWNVIVQFSVLTAGATGTANMSCEWFSSPSGGNVVGPSGVIGAPTISVNTTIPNTIQITGQMSTANAGNTLTEQMLKAVIF